MQFDLGAKTYAIYNTSRGFFATAGLCTHEQQHLAAGMVVDDVIECPLHQGRFHISTGKAVGAPACVDLETYPVKVEDDDVFIHIPTWQSAM